MVLRASRQRARCTLFIQPGFCSGLGPAFTRQPVSKQVVRSFSVFQLERKTEEDFLASALTMTSPQTLYDALATLPAIDSDRQGGGLSTADGRTSLPTAQLVSLAAGLATHLRSRLGIQSADVVSILSTNSVPTSGCSWVVESGYCSSRTV